MSDNDLPERAKQFASAGREQMTDTIGVVSLGKACELLGGDKPISRATLYRMINAGVLVARGDGRLRRVTLESIRRYNTGEVTWQRDENAVQARSNTTPRAVTTSRARPVGAGQVVLLPGKMPRKR